MKFLVCIMVFNGICLIPFSAFADTIDVEESPQEYVELRAGTPIMLEVMNTIDSKHYQRGQNIPIAVSEPVRIDDHLVILPGTQAIAKVSYVIKAKGWGKKGRMGIVIESCYSVDDQEIRISASQDARGSGKGGVATAIGVGNALAFKPLVFTGFAVKGEEAVIPAGTVIKARVDTDYKIAVLDENELQLKSKELQNNMEQVREEVVEEIKRQEEEKKKKTGYNDGY